MSVARGRAKVNRFEQVPRSDVRGRWGMVLGGGYPEGRVCDLSHDACDVPNPPPVDKQTPVKTLPSRNFVCGR